MRSPTAVTPLAALGLWLMQMRGMDPGALGYGALLSPGRYMDAEYPSSGV